MNMGKTADVYFLWGLESYLIDREIQKIISVVQQKSGEEPEILTLDVESLSPRQLLESLDFSPLFSLDRVLVIKRPSWLGKSRKKAGKNDEVQQVLEQYLNNPPAGQTLIITGEEHPASNPIIKLLDKGARVINIKRPDHRALQQWLEQEFQERRREVRPEALALMSDSGQDMYYLANLVEKLCLMHHDRPITADLVEEQLSSNEEIKVFKLTDALMTRNLGAALKAYYQLLSQGESPILFLFMIVRQFVQLARVKHGLDQGLRPEQIEQETGIKAFVVRNMSRRAGQFSWDEIERLFTIFLDADIRLKTSGQDNTLIMEQLIVQICQKQK